MKQNRRLYGAIASFMGALSCLVGGTYAWFVIANVAEASVSGTIVDIEGVEIGIRSAAPLIGAGGLTGATDAATLATLHNLEKDATDIPGTLYWANNGTIGVRTGNFKSGTIEAIAKLNQYSDEFTPVTTSVYVDNGAITLKKGLAASFDKAAGINAYNNAVTGDYLRYTLVFKTPEAYTKVHLKSNGTGIVPSAEAIANGFDDEIISSIRVGFDAGATRRSIYRPGQTVLTPTATTAVAGRMDLDGDGAFDFYEKTDGTKYEIVYGDFAGFDVADDEIAFDADDTLYGVKYSNALTSGGLATAERAGTFSNFLVGATLDGIYAPLAQPTYNTQTHHGLAHYLAGSNDILTTNASSLGELSVTTWVEGWDEGCINGISTEDFALTLGFVAVLA